MKRCFVLSLMYLASCSGSGGPSDGGSDGLTHTPQLVLDASELGAPRGWQLLRGIVHTHSPYSHDACDENPFPEGQRNEECFLQCRAGMCQTAQDFVFLTDHDDLFAYHEYPEVLLYADGDSPVMREGKPVANRIHCPDGRQVLLMAGTETGMMPVGLEQHVGATPAERVAAYNEVSAAVIERYHQVGGLAFLQHTEGWEVEQVLELPIDGIECYNLHQNLMDNLGGALQLISLIDSHPELLPEMELMLIGLFQENTRDMERWSRALEQRAMPAVVASDAHQNAFPGTSPDGERIDSFRRVLHWFSNYLLVPAGPYDDVAVKQALAAGRLYGAFDYLGYPQGFDFYAQADRIYEMGETVPAAGATLELSLPKVYALDPRGSAPRISGRVLKAQEGGWQVVAEGSGDLSLEVGPGAYRAEVRMIPYHLERWLGEEPERYLQEMVWIYSNAIRVVP